MTVSGAGKKRTRAAESSTSGFSDGLAGPYKARSVAYRGFGEGFPGHNAW